MSPLTGSVHDGIPQREFKVGFVVVPTDGGVLFGYHWGDPEKGRIFTLSDQEAFWLGEALIKAKGRT